MDRRSGAGERIERHDPREDAPEAGHGNPALIEALTAEVTDLVGEPEGVLHEVAHEGVHLDLLLVPPSDERPHRTVITCGMSEQPMVPPPEHAVAARAELMLSLPPEWPVTDDPGSGWPLGMLRWLARIPDEYSTWLWSGHTVPNGDPPEPWVEDTALCGALMTHPRLLPRGSDRIAIGEGLLIKLLAVIPLHADEMELKLERGSEVLDQRLNAAGVTELLDPDRPSVADRIAEGEGAVEPVAVRIVPVFESEDQNLIVAQGKLAELGIGPDDAENGAWVSPSEAEEIYTPRYLETLVDRLARLETRDDAVAALAQVREELGAGLFPY